MHANETERRMAGRLQRLGWIAVLIAIPLIGWRLSQLPSHSGAQTAALTAAR